MAALNAANIGLRHLGRKGGLWEVRGDIWLLNLFEQAAETAARKTAAFD